MRLSFNSSDRISDTTLLDDQNRLVYTTTSSTFGRHTQVLKFGSSGTSGPLNLASVTFHNLSPDTITLGGHKLIAKDYLVKPSWFSKSVHSIHSCDRYTE